MTSWLLVSFRVFFDDFLVTFLEWARSRNLSGSGCSTNAFKLMLQSMVSKSISEIGKAITNNLGKENISAKWRRGEIDKAFCWGPRIALVVGTQCISWVPLEDKRLYIKKTVHYREHKNCHWQSDSDTFSTHDDTHHYLEKFEFFHKFQFRKSRFLLNEKRRTRWWGIVY